MTVAPSPLTTTDADMDCTVALLFLTGLVVCGAHPQKVARPSNIDVAAGELPPLRSFHAHVLFELRRGSDTCTGFDDAMRLKVLGGTSFAQRLSSCFTAHFW